LHDREPHGRNLNLITAGPSPHRGGVARGVHESRPRDPCVPRCARARQPV